MEAYVARVSFHAMSTASCRARYVLCVSRHSLAKVDNAADDVVTAAAESASLVDTAAAVEVDASAVVVTASDAMSEMPVVVDVELGLVLELVVLELEVTPPNTTVESGLEVEVAKEVEERVDELVIELGELEEEEETSMELDVLVADTAAVLVMATASTEDRADDSTAVETAPVEEVTELLSELRKELTDVEIDEPVPDVSTSDTTVEMMESEDIKEDIAEADVLETTLDSTEEEEEA